MSWLSRILRYVPKEERQGISLGQTPRWKISPTRDVSTFVKPLEALVPPGSILYLECAGPARKIRSYLADRPAGSTCKVEMGTIWPRPKCYHMPISQPNLDGLAALAETHAAPEIVDHLHVYKDGKMLLEWYDAFSKDPCYVSKDIPEENVRAFCHGIGAHYEAVPEKA